MSINLTEVKDVTYVKKGDLENFEVQICVCRDVVAGVGGILVKIWIAVRVKLHIESEYILLLQPIQMYLSWRDVNLISEIVRKD